MWTASHQLNDLSLDLMHGGTLEDNRVIWRSVDTESSQKRLCCGGEKTQSVHQKTTLNCMFSYVHHL